MKGLLIIPAFNEAGRIGTLLQRIAAAALDLRVVVIDDGSSDTTAAEARRLGVTVLQHPFNLGYGAALQTGYKFALQQDAPHVVQMDADGQHDPADVPRLLAPVAAGTFDLVIGSRFLEPTDYRMSRLHQLGRIVFTGLARLGGLAVSDPTSGFQAMNRHVLEVYASDLFPHDYPDIDVLLAANRHGLRIGEVSVHMAAAERASTLHGGLRSFYYIYKMALSIWSAPARLRRRTHLSRSPTP